MKKYLILILSVFVMSASASDTVQIVEGGAVFLNIGGNWYQSGNIWSAVKNNPQLAKDIQAEALIMADKEPLLIGSCVLHHLSKMKVAIPDDIVIKVADAVNAQNAAMLAKQKERADAAKANP